MAKRKEPLPFVLAVVAIDPGEDAGVASAIAGKVIFSRPASGHKWVLLAPAAIEAVEALIKQGLKKENILGAVEQGWSGGHGMKSSMTLSQRRGIAQAALEATGITRIEYVHSATWQSQVFGGRPKDTKKASMERASLLLDRVVESDDEADAICIASWASENFK